MSGIDRMYTGGFYVTAVDSGRTALLAGPFKSHEAALARVDTSKRIAQQVNDRAIWWAYGTSRDTVGNLPAGKLNEFIGMSPAHSRQLVT